jgi:hypothetical protein
LLNMLAICRICSKNRRMTLPEITIPGLSITNSVGMGCPNRAPDVSIVQNLLNCVPVARGGPSKKLDIDGKFGTNTNEAIYQFQRRNQLACDGRVDPGKKTFTAMLQSSLPDPETSDPNNTEIDVVWSWHPIRNAIVRAARSELRFNRVTDEGQINQRANWQRLKLYYDTVFPRPWAARGEYWPQGEKGPHHSITMLEGVQRVGMKVPQMFPRGAGINWCGIFATWCWRQGGVPSVIWTPGRPSFVTAIPCTQASRPIPGDMMVLRDPPDAPGRSHHVIMNSWPRGDGQFTIISGNADQFQGVCLHYKTYADIQAFYSVDSVPGVLQRLMGWAIGIQY